MPTSADPRVATPADPGAARTKSRPGLARVVAALALAGALAGSLAACGGAGSAPGAAGQGSGTMSVVASFYPLQYAAQQVGGSHVTVTSLTKPGTEPHDLELTPRDVAQLSRAAVAVYARGIQPAVDAAVDQQAGQSAFDVAPHARLDLQAPTAAVGGAAPSATAAAAPSGGVDPHFWLDPQRYATVGSAIAERFSAADPANAADYAANARRFTEALGALDTAYRTATATCQVRQLVTSHAAFGYLAARYGFTQVPIAGLSPDAEPSAARLAEVAAFVKAHGVTTIYTETLVEPRFAETVAKATGARLATLDPIEGLTSTSAGKDYLEVMRSNLTSLRAGQGCS